MGNGAMSDKKADWKGQEKRVGARRVGGGASVMGNGSTIVIICFVFIGGRRLTGYFGPLY